MENVNLSSLISTLLIAIVASTLALGGCTSDTVTGPAPQETAQEPPEQSQPNDVDKKDGDGTDNDNDDDDHNT